MAQQTARKSKGLGGTLTAIGIIILANLKKAVVLLKFTKFGGMFISMIVSLGAYAVFFGWQFAVVLIYLLFVHESGHLVAARQKGIKTSPAVFIPFIGAVISMKQQPKDAATESYLAYGGPLAGLISFLPAIPLYAWTEAPIWLLMIYLGAFLNLLNLLPVSPLDGGRIVSVLSTKIWLIGLLAIIPMIYYLRSPILILIFIIGFFTWWSRARQTYKADVLRFRMEREQEHVQDLQALMDELFFMRRDEEGQLEPVVISEMRLFRLRECRNRAQGLKDDLEDKSSFYFPFLQDEQKLRKEQLKIDLEFESKKINFLDGDSTQYDHLKSKVTQSEKDIKRIEGELEHLHAYYQAPTSTKWKVLVLYVALAAVLGFFYISAQQGMDNVIQ